MRQQPPKQPERRRHLRTELQLPVELFDASGSQRLAVGTTLNLSPGGLLLQLPDADEKALSGPLKLQLGLPQAVRAGRNSLFRCRSVRVEGDSPLLCAIEVLGAPPESLLVPELVGNHPSILEIKRSLLEIVDYDVNVLIQGETGTGKNVVGEVIHRYSRRAGFPVVRVNCPAIPEKLLESELFGHEKGAFTDASTAQPGLFRIANKGTLVFDEISAIPTAMQAKLLQVIEDKTFIPVGSCQTVEVDVRICAATNDNLEQKMAEGQFRRDLFYRLNEISITLPPLRQRWSDIPLLADYFLRKYSSRFGKDYVPFSDAILETFQEYPWPGNVRELENTIKSGVIMGRFAIPGLERAKSDVTRGLRSASGLSGASLSGKNMDEVRAQAVEDAERHAVLQALKASDYNKTRAAAGLGVSYRTLLRKMKRYEIRV